MSNKSKKAIGQSVTSAMPQIKTVVMLMLENRSLDNVLGFLYQNGNAPSSVYPQRSSPSFDGASTSLWNAYHGKKYYVTNGTQSNPITSAPAMTMPEVDPGEEFDRVTNQLYADDYGVLPSGDFWQTLPPMTGFAWDYDSILSHNQDVMGSYNPSQLPGINGLAQNFAVSDRWFSSVPSQTFPNRAYSICGTSLGKLTNSEINGETYADSKTIFNVLADAGKSWGLYWQSEGIASGAPLGDVFTQWLCPQLNNASNGQVTKFSDKNANNKNTFMQQVAAGTLPNFCYVEPQWGGGPSWLINVDGNDYHPSANVSNADYDLNSLYQSLVNSPQWDEMLFIITFDEHGGTYDHVPPTKSISPDGISGDSNFQFNRLGVRIPTILVSPFISAGTVFRSPVYDSVTAVQPDFDHTSILATLSMWAGVDPRASGLGNRVANAPSFDGVLNSADNIRSDKPILNVPQPEKHPDTINPFDEPAPLDESGKPIPAKTIGLKEFRMACDEYKSKPEEFTAYIRKLRYGV